VVENDYTADEFKEFLHPFHEMNENTKEEGVEGVRLYYFMGFTMRDMPQCIVDIFDSVRFQLFNVGIMIYGSIPRVPSGIVWSI